jgi:hypothetical protein
MWLVYARNRDLIGSSQIHRFKWRKSKGSNEWSGPEQVVRVSEIVAAVKRGEQVGTLFHVGGHDVLGPKVIVVHDQHGRERIDVEPWPHPRQQSLFSLPEFD